MIGATMKTKRTEPHEGSKAQSQRLAAELRREILAGERKAGAKLPTEAELSAQYGLSRPSVREAIAILRSQDLAESRRGSGSYVTAQPRLELRLALPTDSTETVVRMIELRRAVECEATRLAAIRRSTEKLDAMRAASEAVIHAEREGRDGVAEDMLFHRLIAEAADNPYLLQMHEACQSVLLQAMRSTRANERRDPALRDEVHREHRRILLAVSAAEGDWAAGAMAAHLAGAERRLRACAGSIASPASPPFQD